LPVQNEIKFVHVLPYRFEVFAPCREYPSLALGGISLCEVMIEALDVLAFPGPIACIVDRDVFDAMEPGWRFGPLLPVSIRRCPRDKPVAVVAVILIPYKHGRDSKHVAAVFEFDIVSRTEPGALLEPDDLAEARLVGDVAGVVGPIPTFVSPAAK
jgi:hypothetical protein